MKKKNSLRQREVEPILKTQTEERLELKILHICIGTTEASITKRI